MSAVVDAHSSQPSSRPWWLRLPDFAFIGMFVFVATPETVVGKPYIGPFPIYFVMFYLGLLGIFIEQMIERKPLPALVQASLGVWAILLIHGVLRGNDFKFMAIDASNILGFTAGAYWIGRRPIESVLTKWHRLAGIVTCLLVFALVGLATGFIKPAIESGRIYVYSVFRAVGILSIIMPTLWAAKEFFPIKRVPYWMFSLPFLFIGLLVWVTAFFTATRSILIECVVSILMIARIAARQARGLAFLAALFLILVMMTLWQMDALSGLVGGELGDRLAATTGAKEQRFVEVGMMLEQMTSLDYLIGTGMGSRFHSVVVVDGTDLALNPHIVVFTFLQKGGILCFLGLVIVPFISAVLRLIRGDGDALYLGAVAGVIMYLLMASISGGWEFYFLFLYGVFVSLMYRGPDSCRLGVDPCAS